MDAHDRLCDRVRVAVRGDRAVDPVLDQLRRGVVLARNHHARRAARRRLDDDHPVALAPGGQQHAHRASHLPLDGRLRSEPRRGDLLREAVLCDRGVERSALGALAEELAAQALDLLRRPGDRRDAQRGLLLGDQPAREQYERVGALRRDRS